MYYEINKKEIKQINFNNIKLQKLNIAYITINELENIYQKLNISEQIIIECKKNNNYSKSNFEIYDNYYFATICIKDIKDIKKEYGKIGLIFQNNLLIIINISNLHNELDNKILNMIKHIKPNYTQEHILSMLLKTSIDGYFDNLQYLENKIINIEKELLKREISSSLNILIYSIKKELSLYKRYFESILYIIQNIKSIDDQILNIDNFKYLNNLEKQLTSIITTTQYLIDNVIHLRDMYQSALDFYQNRVIKLLTVITTIFLPLSLIAAWYGMNFEYMPELQYQYGYHIIIILSIIIVIICFIFFKKKKIL